MALHPLHPPCLLSGSQSLTTTMTEAELYDTTTQRWSLLPKLLFPNFALGAAIVGDYWYLAGGDSDPVVGGQSKLVAAMNFTELMSGSCAAWTLAASMITARDGFHLVVVDV